MYLNRATDCFDKGSLLFWSNICEILISCMRSTTHTDANISKKTKRKQR